MQAVEVDLPTSTQTQREVLALVAQVAGALVEGTGQLMEWPLTMLRLERLILAVAVAVGHGAALMGRIQQQVAQES